MRRIYKLPDGTYAKNVKQYFRAWRALAEPIEKLTGLQHSAFDPDYQFVNGTHSIELPVWFLRLVNDGLERRDQE